MPLDVDAISVRGRWVRHSRSANVALPRRKNFIPDSRWQRGDVTDALYLADEPETAWAEWYRHLAELGLPPAQWLPTYLWTWQVDIEVADLGDEERLERVGLSLPRPGRSSWPDFQNIGESMYRAGWSGLLAPSAARPAQKILCLFRKVDLVPVAVAEEPPEKITEAPVPPTGMRT